MSTKPNHPKNQHYVPQFMLRNFSSQSTSRVHVFDKLTERCFESSTRNIAAESGFYDSEDGGDRLTLEPLMCFVEENASPVIQGILDKESLGHLTHEDRVKISYFAALQRVRVKGIRQRMKSISEGLIDVLEKRGIDGGDIVPKMNDEDVKLGSFAQIGDTKKFAKTFRQKAWVLQRAPEGTQSYTSDNPVTLHNLVSTPDRGGLGLESPGVEIYLPISGRYTICFLCPQIPAYLISNVLSYFGMLFPIQLFRPFPVSCHCGS